MLPDFDVSHALLLQGPAGPFMQRFARELRAAGVAVTKVNFHAGDEVFFRDKGALRYGGPTADFADWVERLMDERGIDGIFLFGDCRPLHRAAIEVARRRRASTWVFEEGYLRPDWFTLEKHGVNGYSKLPKSASFYRSLNLSEPDPPQKVGSSIGVNACYQAVSAVAFTHFNHRFPGYAHHRNLNAWYHAWAWCYGYARKVYFAPLERPLFARLTGALSGRYFFVPLQVHCDYQLQHSPYRDVWEFVEEVVGCFAEHAPSDVSIVFKHHPLDRPFREYSRPFRALSERHGLRERLFYCHDLHLPTLLVHARGTVTINSTVGLSSLGHRTPVKVMGDAVYDFDGMTYQGSLADFFRGAANAPDRELFHQFRRHLLRRNQANGNFYKRLDRSTPTGVQWFPGDGAARPCKANVSDGA